MADDSDKTTLLVKAVAGVFITVVAPVVVAFGIKYSERVAQPAKHSFWA